MVYASDLACGGCRYLGVPYSTMDCQAFVEKVLGDLGLRINLPGSNAWYRKMTWVGTPDECRQKFGSIPPGAFLFILEQDGREPEKYKGDGIGNASHIGIYTAMTGNRMVEIARADGDYGAGAWNFGDGAINSSSSHAHVCTSAFSGKEIRGGWNRIGLWDKISYGVEIDVLLKYGSETSTGGEDMTGLDTIGRVRVTTSGGTLNLRKEPNEDAKILTRIPNGTELEKTDGVTGWSRVTYGGQTGWVSDRFLTKVETADDLVSVSRQKLQEMYDTIGDWLGLRG